VGTRIAVYNVKADYIKEVVEGLSSDEYLAEKIDDQHFGR